MLLHTHMLSRHLVRGTGPAARCNPAGLCKTRCSRAAPVQSSDLKQGRGGGVKVTGRLGGGWGPEPDGPLTVPDKLPGCWDVAALVALALCRERVPEGEKYPLSSSSGLSPRFQPDAQRRITSG